MSPDYLRRRELPERFAAAGLVRWLVLLLGLLLLVRLRGSLLRLWGRWRWLGLVVSRGLRLRWLLGCTGCLLAMRCDHETRKLWLKSAYHFRCFPDMADYSRVKSITSVLPYALSVSISIAPEYDVSAVQFDRDGQQSRRWYLEMVSKAK